jgi:hypothetical protein
MGNSHLTPRPEPEKTVMLLPRFTCRGERVHSDFAASGYFCPPSAAWKLANPNSRVMPLVDPEGDSAIFFGLGTAAHWGPVPGVRSKHRMLNPQHRGPIASRVS